MYFDATGLILASVLGMALLALLFTAHLGWLIALWETRLSKPFPTPSRRLGLIGAALTPLIGFYALRLIDGLRSGKADPPPMEWWRRLLPVVSISLCAMAALRLELRYIPAGRSITNFLENFGIFCAYFLLIAATVHMAATVFNLTQRGLLTSRSQLAVAAFLLALALI